MELAGKPHASAMAEILVAADERVDIRRAVAARMARLERWPWISRRFGFDDLMSLCSDRYRGSVLITTESVSSIDEDGSGGGPPRAFFTEWRRRPAGRLFRSPNSIGARQGSA